ncbi:Mur ligase middle domain-containing protein [Caloramator quimbayensis]|uniref:Mur ligase middle domain-containing protein n=1 Tax=Caloramator quimbayensis TaxID=1147123 RepID=A0A1T4XI56_9CLOT|nr:Mur ligase family protein [Caloramator quimbayensis]SKA89214.1 Mur ligase middle domain-containing protein [Caloramator quimbayensis]
MYIIGVFGSKGKSSTAEIIYEKLKKYEKECIIIGTNQDSSIEFFKILYDNPEYIIIEISREDILEKRLDKIKFDILVQTSLEYESPQLIDEIQNLIKNVKENGYLIFNSDSIQKINFQCDNIYPITYGLNGRTTVTASSIDDIDGLSFSYCLQRAIFTLSNTIIQPFEKPVKFKGDSQDIYYYLPSLTCLLILGYKI